MRHYPELLRIQSDRVQLRGDKKYADKGTLNAFLRGKKDLIIEEKLDGSQMAIGWKGGQPYIQGKNSHIPSTDKRPQYGGVWDWAWSHLDSLEQLQGVLIYGEWVRIRHHIEYDSLPSWFMPFDVFMTKQKRFLPYDKKIAALEKIGLPSPRLLYRGKVNLDLIHDVAVEKKSAFGNENMEGVVIKDYKEQTFIKFVTREFVDGIEDVGHWTSKHKQKLNRLA